MARKQSIVEAYIDPLAEEVTRYLPVVKESMDVSIYPPKLAIELVTFAKKTMTRREWAAWQDVMDATGYWAGTCKADLRYVASAAEARKNITDRLDGKPKGEVSINENAFVEPSEFAEAQLKAFKESIGVFESGIDSE